MTTNSMDRVRQFHVLSFEGPDPYASAGRLARRVTQLADAIAALGYDAHLWFVGDPEREGHERRGRLALHRFCQWISRYHPAGVYDGELQKSTDYAASLPPFLMEHHLLPSLARGEHAIVLAEEWQTVDAVLHLDWLLRQAGLRERVSLLWNASDAFGFERIDWAKLKAAATITTVNHYMRLRLKAVGVDALVIPNGSNPERYVFAERAVPPIEQRAHKPIDAALDPRDRTVEIEAPRRMLRRRRSNPGLSRNLGRTGAASVRSSGARLAAL